MDTLKDQTIEVLSSNENLDEGPLGFDKPRCIECGEPVSPQKSSYDQKEYIRLYCSDCSPVKDVKEHWKPITSGYVSRVFFVKN